MKTKLLLAAMIMLVTVQAHARKGGQDGSGGGGIVQNGEFVTFGSAGFYVHPEPKQGLPSLDLIEKAIDSFKITTAQKAQLLSAVYPLDKRAYYDIQPDGLAPEEYRKLVDQYVKISGMPATQIALFAVTNPRTLRTYLLPAFYKLKAEEQAAILFHESYWIWKPTATYAEVVTAEIAFQKYVEAADWDSYSPELGSAVASIFGDRFLDLNWALASDLAKSTLGDLADSEKGLSVFKVFEIARLGYRFTSQMTTGDLCVAKPEANSVSIYSLSRRYRHSAFLPLLAKKLTEDLSGGIGSAQFLFPAATHTNIWYSRDCYLPQQDTHDWYIKSLNPTPGSQRWNLQIQRLTPRGSAKNAGWFFESIFKV